MLGEDCAYQIEDVLVNIDKDDMHSLLKQLDQKKGKKNRASESNSHKLNKLHP